MSWIVGLPKAEVHLHLEGCIPPDLSAPSRRAPVRGPPSESDTTVAADRTGPITSLPQLLSYLDWSCGLIDRADDLAAIAYGTSRRATASGVRHVDAIVNPTHWPHWQGRLDAMVDALDEGFRAAESEGFATAVLCLSVKRTQEAVRGRGPGRLDPRRPPSPGGGPVDRRGRDERITQRTLRGRLRQSRPPVDCDGVPTPVSPVDPTASGRPSTCSEPSGSTTGCGPSRTRPWWPNWLAGRSPSTSVPPRMSSSASSPMWPSHPVDDLRRQGVRISLNTDDPLLYGVDVAGEYDLCARTFGWRRADVVAMARTSIESCFADEGRRRQLLRELDAFLETSGG